MRDDNRLNELTAPYYGQIQQLAELREDSGLPYDFMIQLLNTFKKNCLFELKYLFKVERRFTRKEYREERRRVNEMFARAKFERFEPDEELELEGGEEELEKAKKEEEPTSKDIAVAANNEVAEK